MVAILKRSQKGVDRLRYEEVLAGAILVAQHV